MPSKSICEACGGKCCRYFALEIDKPTTRRDFDDIRWYLCHENTKVFVEDGEWYLEVQNVCRHLGPDHRCRIYPSRPAICRQHATEDCEGRDDIHFDRELEFHNDAELQRYVAKRFGKRKKKTRKKKTAREKTTKPRTGKKDRAS